MSENHQARKAATEVAEKVLGAIYGDDLKGCSVTLDSISLIVDEGIESEIAKYKALNEALIGAIQQINTVSTPPDKSEVQSIEDIVQVLSQRADAIHQVTSQILEAWKEAQ